MSRFILTPFWYRAGISLTLATVVLVALPVGAANPEAAHGAGGAVASAAPAATAAGLEVLRAGGNAADAAVAVALALAVVHPPAGNLGGGGFAVVRFGDQLEALDFREMAPAAATADMYLDEQGNAVRERSLVGPLAAGVPGSPAGLEELHRRFGALPWAQVVAPAIALAGNGFTVTERLSASLNRARGLLERFPETASVWLPGGEPPAPGATMQLPQLAATLSRYAEHGSDAITEGPLAVAIATISKQYGGMLTAADLAAYRPVWRQPVRFRSNGWEVASMPLPSSGGIILAQTCALAQRLSLAEQPRFGADRAHLLTETWRRAYADRFLMGDPRTTMADREKLLDPAWLAVRADSISMAAATPSVEVRPWPAGLKTESTETTHLSVIDADGNAVSLTTTLNGSFGCGLLVPGVGFLLNNEMDDFAAKPGTPNQFGLVQGEANAVGAGKRMLSSMTPTVAWRGDEVIVLGSPGGSRIPTATAQVLLNLIVDEDDLQAAVNRPRIHHQWLPDQIMAEPDALAPETRAELERRGHQVTNRNGLGIVNAVRRLANGELEAAADPRGPCAAGVVSPAPGHN
jgi:gamma-glutamyltranspeptidase/glutathione hydrolase